jgi:hypothetical protein
MAGEEEGTDNFGNHNNAAGMLEAMQRGDDFGTGLQRRAAGRGKRALTHP